MLKDLNIAEIKVGTRHRKDMGDLTFLAESIRQEGLLQPIGVSEKMELVFGERRIRAVRDILKQKTILARIVDVTSIILGEYAENEINVCKKLHTLTLAIPLSSSPIFKSKPRYQRQKSSGISTHFHSCFTVPSALRQQTANSKNKHGGAHYRLRSGRNDDHSRY